MTQRDKAGILLNDIKHYVLLQLITDLHYDEEYLELESPEYVAKKESYRR